MPRSITSALVAILPALRDSHLKTGEYLYPSRTHLALESAGTLLLKKGIDVRFSLAPSYGVIDWLDALDERTPDLICFEARTPEMHFAWDLIDTMKTRFPDCIITLSGRHASAMPQDSFEHSKVDYVLAGGNYDLLIDNLVDVLTGKAPELEPGIWFRRAGGVKQNTRETQENKAAQIPFIDREKTGAIIRTRGNAVRIPQASIVSSRTDSLPSRYYSDEVTRPAERVVTEIGMLAEEYRVREIVDRCGRFPDGAWLKRFCGLMRKRSLAGRLLLRASHAPNTLTDETANILRRTGFRELGFTIFSANEKTCSRIGATQTPDEVVSNIECAARAGIQCSLTVYFGFPWEDEDDIRTTQAVVKQLVRSRRVQRLWVRIAVPLPGTYYFDECETSNLLRTRNYTRYDGSAPVTNNEVDDGFLYEIIRSTYATTFDPRFLFASITGLRGMREYNRYFSESTRNNDTVSRRHS